MPVDVDVATLLIQVIVRHSPRSSANTRRSSFIIRVFLLLPARALGSRHVPI